MSNPRASRVSTPRVRHNEVLHGDGSKTAEDSVFCETRGTTVPLETCAVCSQKIRILVQPDADGTVSCRTERPAPDRTPARRATGTVDFREAALRIQTGQLLEQGVVSVAADTSIDALKALFAMRPVRSAAVVDGEGKLTGIVSEADLLRWHESRGERDDARGTSMESGLHIEDVPAGTVDDIMSPVVHALPEDAPVAYAFGLFAGKDLREVPVVTEHGRFVGMLTSTDLLRWVARDLGYVL
jgi:CBS domain-containing protein